MTTRTRPNPAHLLGVFVVAAINSLQSRVNGAAGAFTGHPTIAAIVSFGGGWILVFGMVFTVPAARRAFLSLPKLIREGQLKWWQCIGGMAGALFVIGQGFVVPEVGVALFIISIVAGQTVSSLFVDKFGLGPAGPRAISGLRVMAALFAVGGVIISALGRSEIGDFSLPAIMYAFATGCTSAAQYAINGRVAVATKQPTATTLLNFTMGLVMLGSVLLVQTLLGRPLAAPPNPLTHPWLWMGGPLGVLFIVAAAVYVRTLGVLVFSLTSVVGQLTGALLIDIFMPTAGSHISAQLLLGLAITAGAVSLAALGNREPTHAELDAVVIDSDAVALGAVESHEEA